jgi:hypothetical protein
MGAIRLDERGVMLRPCFADDCVRRRAAELALDEFEGLGYGFDEDDDDDAYVSREEAIAVLMDAIHGRERSFRLVFERDVSYETPSAIFNEQYVYDALRELMEQWVACLKIELVLSIGAVVTCDAAGETGEVRGAVAELRPATAEYGIKTMDLPDGQLLVCAAELVALDWMESDGLVTA